MIPQAAVSRNVSARLTLKEDLIPSLQYVEHRLWYSVNVLTILIIQQKIDLSFKVYNLGNFQGTIIKDKNNITDILRNLKCFLCKKK
jgi:ArsR family metal-binding transcriptional regulator